MSDSARDKVSCEVYGSRRQEALYVYLRTGLLPNDLPTALLERTGVLREVMTLELTPQRRLAHLDVNVVIRALNDVGYYVQLPPGDRVNAHLHFGD